MTDLNLQEILEFAISVAQDAGGMILQASRSRLSTTSSTMSEKMNSVDLVTETDKAVEEMVKKAISETYKDHKFIGEETYSAGQESVLDDSPTWIVDPIDGTTNFVHGVPYVAISIGFTVNRRPTVGVVLNPFAAQLYTAIRSQGAFLTLLSSDLTTAQSTSKLPLYSTQPLEFQSSVIAIEYGSDRRGNNYMIKVDTFKELASAQGGMVHALRAYGSAALNLCSVASGFIDGYWEGGCWEWDVCAGWVILEEAGGTIVSGNPPRKGMRELSNPDLCGRVYLAVRKARSQKEVEDWVKRFWSCTKGELVYGR